MLPPVVGARVVVPLGSRLVTGIVVEADCWRETTSGRCDRRCSADAIKTIHRVLDEDAFIPADVVALARWTAEYYAAGVGRDDHRGASAQDARRCARCAQDRRIATITDDGPARLDSEQLPSGRPGTDDSAGSARRSSVLAGRARTGLATAVLGAAAASARHVLAVSPRRGLVDVRHDRVDPRSFRARLRRWRRGCRSRHLTGEQDDALARSAALVDDRRVSRRAAARRDRQRQDRDLSPALARAVRDVGPTACSCSSRRLR